MNHTPAPWAFQTTGYNNSGRITARGKSVAAIASSIQRTAEENLGNLQLISAAPELLTALQALLVYAGERASTEHESDHPITLARNALVKAGHGTPADNVRARANGLAAESRARDGIR